LRPALCKAAIAWLAAMASTMNAPAAHADLWAYVDEQGRSHVANRQVDARYTLFFKGETTLAGPNDAPTDRAQAVAALAGTRIYRRATRDSIARDFASLIERHARTNGLDPALVKAVVAVESDFNPGARSPKGAVGLMQVIPDTGERYGLTDDVHASIAQKLLDPATNVRIGTRYLRDLLAHFTNDLPLALAAYNAGEGSVALHNNSIPPFDETRDYVKLVQQVYALYRPEPPQPAPSRRPVLRLRSVADVGARDAKP
jgi:soluble lytic murein transglycosylase-like protein